ncbi:DUF6891 domain-containing protein [Streptomyces rimosus]|uniref:DUF6891 domain-containing protein n=1 Tax=Streptomyces rimosus TaxID=1927 RepID=UPI00067D23EC
MEQATWQGATVGAASLGSRGFVYFHAQCTALAVAVHGLMLLYSGFGGSSATTMAIGQEVADALGNHPVPSETEPRPRRPPLD